MTSKKLLIIIILLYAGYGFSAPLELPRKITDATGKTFIFRHKIQKIISLAPNLTELIFSAGAGDRLVGTVQNSDYPESAKTITVIGSYDNFGLKNIVKLQPDLVFAWHSGTAKKIIRQLKLLNIKVFVLDTSTLQKISNSLKTLGLILNTSDIADKNAKNFEQALHNLKPKKTIQSLKNTPKVFIQIWSKPLITLNKESIFSEVVRFCGGRNLFANAKIIAPKISPESVLKKLPDIILISDNTGKKYWRQFAATKNIPSFYIDPDFSNRATLRTLSAVKKICGIIRQNPA